MALDGRNVKRKGFDGDDIKRPGERGSDKEENKKAPSSSRITEHITKNRSQILLPNANIAIIKFYGTNLINYCQSAKSFHCFLLIKKSPRSSRMAGLRYSPNLRRVFTKPQTRSEESR